MSRAEKLKRQPTYSSQFQENYIFGRLIITFLDFALTRCFNTIFFSFIQPFVDIYAPFYAPFSIQCWQYHCLCCKIMSKMSIVYWSCYLLCCCLDYLLSIWHFELKNDTLIFKSKLLSKLENPLCQTASSVTGLASTDWLCSWLPVICVHAFFFIKYQ